MKFLRNEKGFTLIELVIIIVILGILAATAIPRFVDMTNKAEAAATKGALGGLRGGIAIAYANRAVGGNAGYPGNTSELQNTMADNVLPENPYNNLTTVDIAPGQVTSTGLGTFGWIYNNRNGQIWSAVNGDGSANAW